MEEKFNGKLSCLPEDVAHSTPVLLSFSVVCILHHNNEGEEANKSACIWVLTRIHRLVYTLFYLFMQLLFGIRRLWYFPTPRENHGHLSHVPVPLTHARTHTSLELRTALTDKKVGCA